MGKPLTLIENEDQFTLEQMFHAKSPYRDPHGYYSQVRFVKTRPLGNKFEFLFDWDEENTPIGFPLPHTPIGL
jgi:hypothetical protein